MEHEGNGETKEREMKPFVDNEQLQEHLKERRITVAPALNHSLITILTVILIVCGFILLF